MDADAMGNPLMHTERDCYVNAAVVSTERVTISAQIGKPAQEQLVKIAARKDLKFSDVLRAAINDYIAKEGN